MTSSAIPTHHELRTAFDATCRVTQNTPLLDAPSLAQRIGAERAFVKAESLQLAGSFKIRGAYWRLTCLNDNERARGVIAYSSGNFAQGLAAAGARLGVPVTVVMPIDAPEAKRRATEQYGATVILSDHGERAREEAASELSKTLAVEKSLTLLHPFDDPLIVAGQAGAGLEAIEQLDGRGQGVDLVLCCVGGGGLIGGIALAFHYWRPDTEIIAVEPSGYDSMGKSLRRGQPTRAASGAATICDALQATKPGVAPFAAAVTAGVRGVAVDDNSVKSAMRYAFEKLKLVLEPSGAITLAALLDGTVSAEGLRVLVYATGGNAGSVEDFVRCVGPSS